MKRLALNISRFVLLLAIFFLLTINIIASQSVSPLFYGVAKGEKNTVIVFLQKIERLPEFSNFLEMNKNIYGETIANKVYSPQKNRSEKIASLKNLLIKNPKSRDVLYDLYLLYKEAGNENKASEYYTRAKEIDPTLR